MPSNPLLSFAWVESKVSHPLQTVVMLHGILGQKRNLFGFARQFVARFPSFKVLLVDLRNHGNSQGFGSPHTLSACAEDLKALFNELQLAPYSIVGHSFGGAVTLTYARQYGHSLASIWILDAVPSISPEQPRAVDPQTELILQTLQSCQKSRSKTDFASCLENRGISSKIIAWLSMNLVEEANVLHFKPEPNLANEMMNDLKKSYIISNFQIQSETKIFLVRAQGNSDWNETVLKEIHRHTREGNLRLLCLPHSGHWVHIDNPVGVLEMMAQDFA